MNFFRKHFHQFAKGSFDAFAKLDPNFAPSKNSIIFGYGDQLSDAYKWLNRMKETITKPAHPTN